MRPSDFMQKNPVRLDISRSRFKMSPRWTGTFNSYKLVPFFTYTDILPGDTFKVDTSFVLRMSTPVAPVMDDLFLDVAFYFVPHELILSRSYMSPSTNDSNHSFKAFIGAQDSLLNMPVPDSDIELPHVIINSAYYRTGGIADCMGVSKSYSSSPTYWINALAPLAFMAVWNENYREPNTSNPGVFSISNNNVFFTWSAVGLSGSNSFAYAYLPHTCRFHGYFGSALPWPQRNSETVLLPLGSTAPVIGSDDFHNLGNNHIFADSSDITSSSASYYNLYLKTTGDPNYVLSHSGVANSSAPASVRDISRTSLVADLANASAVSINVFRLAVQEQRWFEALARGGNRIDELTSALFGVMPKDAGGNQPEYLGGKRIPLQVSQVNATNATDGDTLGKVGAFSLTSDSDHYFTKSFDKWGTLLGVCTVRYRDSFGHSLNRMFTRRERFDFYFPQFANLGEMPIYKHELDLGALDSNNAWPTSSVFGYQEAWADYRAIPDIVCGLVRPGQSLDFWTYALSEGNFEYTDQSMVNDLAGFLNATDADVAIDRTLQVSSSTSGFQFLAQFQLEIIAVRPMPLYSIPGLVDHH